MEEMAASSSRARAAETLAASAALESGADFSRLAFGGIGQGKFILTVGLLWSETHEQEGASQTRERKKTGAPEPLQAAMRRRETLRASFRCRIGNKQARHYWPRRVVNAAVVSWDAVRASPEREPVSAPT